MRGGPFDGTTIPVTAPDNNLLLLDFGDATFAVVDGTFNVVASRSPRMEVFGLEGTLLVNRDDVPAPPVELYRLDAAPGSGRVDHTRRPTRSSPPRPTGSRSWPAGS